MAMTTERTARPLPESLRAIEAGYEADLRAAHADIEHGSILLAGVVEPLRSLPGYLWLVACPDEIAALVHGIEPTLAEAKAAVEAAAANLAKAMLTEGVCR